MTPRRAAALVAALSVGCGAASSSTARPLARGPWGSSSILLTVDAAGARVELGCAHGSIDAPLTEGVLDLPGTYVQESGVAPESPFPVRPARYRGQADADVLDFTIVTADASLGPFRAVRGVADDIPKCPAAPR